MARRAGRKENELKDGTHSVRAACLRSFPEFIADIRMGALGKGGELSTGLADFTLSVRLQPVSLSVLDLLVYRQCNT